MTDYGKNQFLTEKTTAKSENGSNTSSISLVKKRQQQYCI